MISYRDMTFCSSDCMNEKCFRHFSEVDRKGAIKWWGNPNAPVSYSDFSKQCPDYTKENSNV